jgi:hypothetical protein
VIRQSELHDAARIRAGLVELERNPSVAHYLAEKDRLARAMDGFRERVKAGEEREPGRVHLVVDVTPVIAWGKVLTALQALEPIKRAVAGCREAQTILDSVVKKDISAPFIGKRTEVKLVGEA